MGTEPTVGWNVRKTYGPVYLFLEKYDGPRKRANTNEGHHFVTRNGTVVAYTRCWHWQKGFQGDPSEHRAQLQRQLEGGRWLQAPAAQQQQRGHTLIQLVMSSLYDSRCGRSPSLVVLKPKLPFVLELTKSYTM